MCFCYEALCVRLTEKPTSQYVGRAYLSCRERPPCEFVQWINQPWTPYMQEVGTRLEQLPVIHSIAPVPENWKPDRLLAVNEWTPQTNGPCT